MVYAATIASVALGAIILFVAEDHQSGTLWAWIGRVWVVTGLWLVFGPLWELVSGSGGGPKSSGAGRSAGRNRTLSPR